MTGYQNLAGEFRMAFDGSDPWGSAMGWFFGVADVLWHAGEDSIPPEWEYGHSPVCDGPEDYPDAEISEMFDSGEIDLADLVRFGNMLSRYTDILRAAGHDY